MATQVKIERHDMRHTTLIPNFELLTREECLNFLLLTDFRENDVLEAMKFHDIFEYLSPARMTERIIDRGLDRNPSNIRSVPKEHRTSKRCMKLIICNGALIQYVPEDEMDEAMIKAALRQNVAFIKYVPVSKRTSNIYWFLFDSIRHPSDLDDTGLEMHLIEIIKPILNGNEKDFFRHLLPLIHRFYWEKEQ